MNKHKPNNYFQPADINSNYGWPEPVLATQDPSRTQPITGHPSTVGSFTQAHTHSDWDCGR